jgi:putative zinc finger protein
MTSLHIDYLELAAGELDLELSADERSRLAVHLASCTSCRRGAIGLRADQRALAQLQPFVLDPAVADRVWRNLEGRRHSPLPALRLVAIAAALALLALATIAVGSQLLQRDADNRLTVVPPAVSEDLRTPAPSESPTPTARLGDLAAGTVVDVVVTALRVRTAPTIDNSKSAKLDPLIGVGAQLEVLDGPVTADGYDWYLVQALGSPHRGWVAAADHDGEPWIQAHAEAVER